MASTFDMETKPVKRDLWLFDVNENDVIVDHSFNGRFQQRDVTALVDSIRTEGQKVPGLVRRAPGGKVFLVAGFGRWDAIKKLNAENPKNPIKFKATIVEGNDTDAFLSNVTENFVRDNPTYMDKAFVVSRLTDQYGKGDAEIAKILNFKSVSSVSQYRALMRLSDENRLKLHSGELQLSNALLLVGQTEEEQKEAVQAATTPEGKVDSAKVREKVREIRERKATPKVEAPKTDDERVDEAIAKGEVPPKGTGQSEPSYRREVLNMLNDGEEEAAIAKAIKAEPTKKTKGEKALERTMRDVKRFHENLSNTNRGVFLFASALTRYISGELSDEQYYSALELAANANATKAKKVGV
jgi:ParB/RepB/Spo0J family partition protein